jgi:hypothetical protein
MEPHIHTNPVGKKCLFLFWFYLHGSIPSWESLNFPKISLELHGTWRAGVSQEQFNSQHCKSPFTITTGYPHTTLLWDDGDSAGRSKIPGRKDKLLSWDELDFPYVQSELAANKVIFQQDEVNYWLIQSELFGALKLNFRYSKQGLNYKG